MSEEPQPIRKCRLISKNGSLSNTENSRNILPTFWILNELALIRINLENQSIVKYQLVASFDSSKELGIILIDHFVIFGFFEWQTYVIFCQIEVSYCFLDISNKVFNKTFAVFKT